MKKTLLLTMIATVLLVVSCNNDDGDATTEQPVTAEQQPIANEDVQATDDEVETVNLSKGESGDLRINLQWYCKTDLDLHVIDPCGNEIYFSKRKATCHGGTGILDNDISKTSRPQEQIYWHKPSPGTYTVKVLIKSAVKDGFLAASKTVKVKIKVK